MSNARRGHGNQLDLARQFATVVNGTRTGFLSELLRTRAIDIDNPGELNALECGVLLRVERAEPSRADHRGA